MGPDACAELRWWLAQLRKEDSVGVPMASRHSFPSPSPGVLMPYSDASRERASPQSSGFGAWAVLNEEFCYVEGRWLAWELEQLSINVLEASSAEYRLVYLSGSHRESKLSRDPSNRVH